MYFKPGDIIRCIDRSYMHYYRGALVVSHVRGSLEEEFLVYRSVGQNKGIGYLPAISKYFELVLKREKSKVSLP